MHTYWKQLEHSWQKVNRPVWVKEAGVYLTPARLTLDTLTSSRIAHRWQKVGWRVHSSHLSTHTAFSSLSSSSPPKAYQAGRGKGMSHILGGGRACHTYCYPVLSHLFMHTRTRPQVRPSPLVHAWTMHALKPTHLVKYLISNITHTSSLVSSSLSLGRETIDTALQEVGGSGERRGVSLVL